MKQTKRYKKVKKIEKYTLKDNVYIPDEKGDIEVRYTKPIKIRLK